jgi:endonuclease/exonuclease/phosphatase family metal-dependent hydrolase
VRVVTWNLWWRFGPWEQRAAAIEATLRALDADVICLQETWVNGDEVQALGLAAALGMDVAVGDAPRWNDQAFANVVLSRRPVSRHETLVLPDEHGAPSHRRATIATVETDDGQPELVVVSTHIEHRFSRSATRVAQVAALQRHLHAQHHESRVVVIGGDLNCVPDADEMRLLQGRTAPAAPLVFVDAWEMAGDRSPGWTWRADNPFLATASWPNRRIDYVLVSAPRPDGLGRPVGVHLAGLQAVDGVWPSDHAAVVADLTWPISAGPRSEA